MRKKNRTYKHKQTTRTKHIKDHLQDMNQRVGISMINNGNPFTFIEEPNVQLSVAVIEKPSSLTNEEPDVQLSVAVIEEKPSSLTVEEPDAQLSVAVIEEKPLSLTIEEPEVQLSVAVIEEKPSSLTIEEPDAQLSVAVIEEKPSSLTIEEPDVQLSVAVMEEKPSSLTIDDSDAQPSAEVTNETPPLFLYIYETNVQLFKEVAELRKDVQVLTQLINEVLQQDVRTEINPSLESLNRRHDYTSEQMIVQQQKIDEMMKLLCWNPRNHPYPDF
jgi:hypothetical protein